MPKNQLYQLLLLLFSLNLACLSHSSFTTVTIAWEYHHWCCHLWSSWFHRDLSETGARRRSRVRRENPETHRNWLGLSIQTPMGCLGKVHVREVYSLKHCHFWNRHFVANKQLLPQLVKGFEKKHLKSNSWFLKLLQQIILKIKIMFQK